MYQGVCKNPYKFNEIPFYTPYEDFDFIQFSHPDPFKPPRLNRANLAEKNYLNTNSRFSSFWLNLKTLNLSKKKQRRQYNGLCSELKMPSNMKNYCLFQYLSVVSYY